MSLLENIEKARKNLTSVETTVTFEDGTRMYEKRSPDGSFAFIDDSNEQEAKEGQVVPEGSDRGSAGSSDDSGDPLLSHRQLKARLRRLNQGYVLDLRPDLQMANVSEGVYLGSQDVAHELDILTKHGITHILNCATGVRNIFLGKIKYLTIDVLDLPCTNLAQYFDECHAFMRGCVESGGNVLVHCNAGISRSATIVISYIMRYEGMSLEEALQHVCSLRRVSPNPGFMQQLLTYQGVLKSSSSTADNAK